MKRSVKLIGAAAVIAASALVASACSAPAQNESDAPAVESLVIDKSFDLVTADPARMYETTGGIVLHAVYDSLLTFADGNADEPLPSVASEWSVNEDATEYTFDHLAFDPGYAERVTKTYYESGHMMYVRRADREKLKRDVAALQIVTVGAEATAGRA